MAEVYTIEQLREEAFRTYNLIPTEITDFKVSGTVYLNQTAVICGKLMGSLGGLGFLKGPIGGAPIEIWIDGKKYTTVYTANDGYFEYDVTGSTLGAGTHQVQAVFQGDLVNAPTRSQSLTITVYNAMGNPGTVPPTTPGLESLLPIILALGAGAIGLTLIIYGVVSKPKTEEAKAPPVPQVVVVKG
jgi:hypothetical protein